MEQRQPAAEVLAQDDERRARHRILIDAQADRDPAREDRLARAELAPERDHVPGLGVRGEPLAQTLGVQRRMADEVEGRGVIRRVFALRIGGVHE